ncbi:hypothetical protein [Pandoraea bronchicola]|uniref:hypothetical protein n=1 Tax=Pandoraea bronchicola TaxID=2508287 RepID=UPI00124047E1|nr:hypothetical protein [Pandoraea bronchicola]
MTRSGNVREIGNGAAQPAVWPPLRCTAAILPREATRDMAKGLGAYNAGQRAPGDGIYVALVAL